MFPARYKIQSMAADFQILSTPHSPALALSCASHFSRCRHFRLISKLFTLLSEKEGSSFSVPYCRVEGFHFFLALLFFKKLGEGCCLFYCGVWRDSPGEVYWLPSVGGW